MKDDRLLNTAKPKCWRLLATVGSETGKRLIANAVLMCLVREPGKLDRLHEIEAHL